MCLSNPEPDMLEGAADDIQPLGCSAESGIRGIVQPLVGETQTEQVRDEVLDLCKSLRTIALQILGDAPGIVDIGAHPIHVAFLVVQPPPELPDAVFGVAVLEGVADAGDGAVKIPGAKILEF